MSKRLKQYLVDALDGKNEILNKIANDHHYKEQLESMVEDFVFTEQSFEADLLKTGTKLLQIQQIINTLSFYFFMQSIWIYIIPSTVVGIKEMC